MTKQAQKVALPAYMRKRLTAYVLEEGSIKKYLIKDKVKDEILALEPWQFFVLEILPGCDNFPKLASIFQDRFGNPVLENQIDELFSLVSEKDFFGFTARQHPMLLPYMENRLTRLNAEKNVQAGVSHEAVIQGNNAVSSKPDLPGESPVRAGSADKVESSAEDEAVAGISEAIGFNESIGVRRWHLFDPRSMLKHVQPWLMPLKNIIYILPLMLIIAVSLSVKHAGVISADLGHFLNNRTFVEVILLSMFTVNLLVTLTIAMVAHHYRATVNSISIVLIWGFIPRFMAKVGHTQQLSRRERMWLHVSPLLMRLTILSLGLFTWYSSRSMNGMLSELSLALAFISLASFVFTANPLIRSNGYHLLSAFLNEPHLRGKAYKALFNKIRGNVYKESDNNILAAYALASTVFMLTMFLLVVVILSFLLKQKLGGAGIMLVAFIAIYPLHRMVKQFRKIEKAYERSVQFDRWRKRALPEQSSDSDEKKKVSNLRFYLKKAVPYSLLLLMFFPYDYEPGGSFIIFPEKQQILTSDIEGIVDDVYYDGGEVLKKGVVIARLVSDDFQAQVNIYSSKMSEQQSVIDELRSRPRAEEVSLAERTLEVEKTRANFSKANVDRLQKLYTEGAISFDDLEEAKRE
ncbi:MAG: hypothetical protein OEY89_09575, partial [Gammaproteobacteria bacterium]|nr:hypothetical protein [Gammaproteobacteria bacterium]